MKNFKRILIIFILFFAIFLLRSSDVFAVTAEYDAPYYVHVERADGHNWRWCANEPFDLKPELANNGSAYYWSCYKVGTNTKFKGTLYYDGAVDFDNYQTKFISYKTTDKVVSYRGENMTMYTVEGDIFWTSVPPTVYPAIVNSAEDLATGTFDYVLINPGTFSSSESIGFGIYKNDEDNSDIYSKNPLFSTMLVKESKYYKSVTVEDVTEFWYEIPRANLDISLKNGDTYMFVLLLDG